MREAIIQYQIERFSLFRNRKIIKFTINSIDYLELFINKSTIIFVTNIGCMYRMEFTCICRCVLIEQYPMFESCLLFQLHCYSIWPDNMITSVTNPLHCGSFSISVVLLNWKCHSMGQHYRLFYSTWIHDGWNVRTNDTEDKILFNVRAWTNLWYYCEVLLK